MPTERTLPETRMRRIAPALVLVALLLVAGCTSGPGQRSTPTSEPSATLPTTDEDSTSTSATNTTNASTVWNCNEAFEYHRVTSIPYPEIPDTLTNDSVAAFAEEVERAYFYREHAGHVANFTSVDSSAVEVNRTDGGWLVYVRDRGYSIHRCYGPDKPGVAMEGTWAHYFINESAVYRQGNAQNADSEEVRTNGTRVI